MALTDQTDAATSPASEPARHPGPTRARTALLVGAFVLLAVALRLPFLGVPAGQDEAGFLLVADQWGPGGSLYGDLWVDRPPLLVVLFELAGSTVGLRVLGCVAAGAVVALVGWAAYVARGHRAALAAAATAALFCADPRLGAVRVNGELLAAPFVAAAMGLTVLMVAEQARRPRACAAAAGAASAAAFAVKQSSVDGFVFGVVALGVLALTRPEQRRRAGVLLLWAMAGALATAGLLLAYAATRGTGPLDLFDAVVTFRAEAGEVIRTSASSATTDRLWLMVAAWASSGLAVLGVASLVLAVKERRDPVVVATAAVVVAVSAVALLGGSYWLHYLVQLVPASALAAGLLLARWKPTLASWRGRVAAGLTALLVAGAGVAIGIEVRSPLGEGPSEAIGHMIRDASEPGDTVVVAFGMPNVVAASGLDTPYEHLWSLPVRTRDSDLAELSAIVESPERPTWVVQWTSFDTWGVDGSLLTAAVERHYDEVAELCGRTVWLRSDVERAPEAMTADC